MKLAHLSATASSVSAVLILASTLAPASRGQVGPSSEKGKAISPAQARAEVDQIAKDLAEARRVAARIGDKAVRERMELILGRSELRARDLSDNLARARPAQSLPVLPTILSAPEFDKLLNGVKKEPFDAGKLIYIENFATIRPLSCEQAAAFLKCFSFDDGRIRAAKLLYPKLVDRQNLNDVLDAFVFPNSKAEVRKAVGLK